MFHFTLYSQCYILGSCYYSTDYTRQTPNGTDVNVCLWKGSCPNYSDEQNNVIKQAALNYWRVQGKDLNFEYIGKASRKYNCHAYAWHITEGGDEVWMLTPNDDEYWLDGSYVEADESEATKVSYGNCPDQTVDWPDVVCNDDFTQCTVIVRQYVLEDFLCDHSAVITDDPEAEGYFISKWGSFCIFQHKNEDCPYLVTDSLSYFKRCREYYTQDIPSDFTKEDCCEFVLQNVTIYNNSEVILKTKGYDKYKQIDEYIQIDGPFEIQLGSTLSIQ